MWMIHTIHNDPYTLKKMWMKNHRFWRSFVYPIIWLQFEWFLWKDKFVQVCTIWSMGKWYL